MDACIAVCFQHPTGLPAWLHLYKCAAIAAAVRLITCPKANSKWLSGNISRCCVGQSALVANEVYCDYNLSVMKKLILVFALVLFPFQVCWAAMGAYCHQDQGSSSPYCAEYNLQPLADAQSDQGKDVFLDVYADIDCSSCGVLSPAIVSLHSKTFPTASVAFQRHIASGFRLSTVAERPERPQWPSFPA